MSKKKILVEEYMNEIDDPKKVLINLIRNIILDSSTELVEGIKWNAPSYSCNSNDIITFNFQALEYISLIFHTGPKGRDTHSGNHLFDTHSEIIEWVADKRFIVKIPKESWIDKNRTVLKEIILKWIEYSKNNFDYQKN